MATGRGGAGEPGALVTSGQEEEEEAGAPRDGSEQEAAGSSGWGDGAVRVTPLSWPVGRGA